MANRPLIKESLFILNLCGANPKNRNALTNVALIVSQTAFIGVAFEILLPCISNWQGLHSMKYVVAIIELYQLAFKLMVMVTNQKVIVRLLDNMEKFWPMHKYGEKLQNEIQNTYRFFRRCINILFVNVIIVTYLYICQPLFSSSKTPLPFKTAHLGAVQPPSMYYLNYFLQASVAYPGPICLVGFDGLFLALIINITCELRILKQGLRSVRINSDSTLVKEKHLEEVRALIDHHNLILNCIKDMDKMYRGILLNAFFFDMITICVSLLGIISARFPPSFSILSSSILNASTYVLQLFMYSMVGSYLTSESEGVAMAIYESDWWAKNQLEFRRTCAMIIQRANKSEELTAGGMFTLNLDTYTKILRATLTFFTFMQAIYKVED